MIVDLATAAGAPVEVDVSVAGAGVAGTTIALKLVSAGYRVAIVEAGGNDFSPASQDFYVGENTGVPNLPLHETRLRMLGGSSNHWGGWCRPLDPYDLGRTDLTAGGGWPIAEADLAPYHNQAAAILGVGTRVGADVPLADADGNLQAIRMMFSEPPLRFRVQYGDAYRRAPNLTVFLNASVADIGLSAAGRVESFAVRSAASQTGFECRARAFVLAMGTAENNRMLLNWNERHDNRVANPDLLGRYYMQHLHQVLGEFVTIDNAAPLPPMAAGERPRAFFASTEKFLRETGLGAFRLNSAAMDCSVLIDELTRVASEAFCRSITGGGQLLITCEQLPNAESRITLLAETDALGQKRVRLDWQINDGDRRTLKEAGLEFGRYLVRGNLGRLKVNADVLAGAAPLKGWEVLGSAPGAAGHQLGGARMGKTPENGVTDSSCRLWPLENLYVAGAAVFRTGGHANPTLTITQLGLRLADEVERRLRAG